MSKPKKTREEYMAIARVLGKHFAAELSSMDPFAQAASLAIHFLLDKPRCPMCLGTVAKANSNSTIKRDA
jgi:hypothetical protein